MTRQDDGYEVIRSASVARLMGWPFNYKRERAEQIAEAEIQTMKDASARFSLMLSRIAADKGN